MFSLFPRTSDALSLLPPNPNSPGLLGFLCDEVDVDVGREVGMLISLEWEDTESSSPGVGEEVILDDGDVADGGVNVGAGLVMCVGLGLGVVVGIGLALAEVIVGVDAMKDDDAGLRVDEADETVFELANRAAIGGMEDPDEAENVVDVDVDSEELRPW